MNNKDYGREERTKVRYAVLRGRRADTGLQARYNYGASAATWRGVVGRIKDRILGHVMKPCAAIVLTNEEQELLKAYRENPEKINGVVNACAVTAEDLKEATDRIVTLARGHHIRNADGTVTDVSNDPRYKCK